MCVGGSAPSPPPPPPPPAPPKEPPKMADAGVRQAGTDMRKQAALATGRSGTILTGAQGLAGEASTQRKTLLGQ